MNISEKIALSQGDLAELVARDESQGASQAGRK